jgi:hypothetical protein
MMAPAISASNWPNNIHHKSLNLIIMLQNHELLSLEHKAEVLMRSERQLDRIIGALCTMKSESIEGALEGIAWCNDATTDEFLVQMNRVFRQCEEQGNRYLYVYAGKCSEIEACRRGSHPGFVFVTDLTRDYFSFRFIVDGEKVLSFSESPCIRTPVAMKPSAKRLTFQTDSF